MQPNTTTPSTRRPIELVIGWGPTAFNVRLTPNIQAQLFQGSGWIIEDGTLEPISSLELFLELQHDRRLSW